MGTICAGYDFFWLLICKMYISIFVSFPDIECFNAFRWGSSVHCLYDISCHKILVHLLW